METVSISRDNGVVTVTMNRPEKKNAANGVMFEELRQTFLEVRANEEDRCMVLTGAEGNFCAGADLSDLRGATMDIGVPGVGRMRRIGEIATALSQLTIPTIAQVEGMAVGAGMSLAIGCDLVVASLTAKFSMIFARRGLSPDMGASWLLPRQVGMARAKELVLLADIIDAQQGFEMGFVNRVVNPEDLESETTALALRLALGPTLALGLAKTLLNNSFATSLDQAMEDEARAQALNFESEDTREALQAFLEKRSPQFKGR